MNARPRSPLSSTFRCARRAVLGVLAASTLVLAAGCGSDDDDVLTIVPPLVVRDSRPAIPLVGEYVRNFFGTQDLSVTFDRAPESGVVSLQLFPPPASDGGFRPTGSGRNYTWFDVELLPADGAYFWLIDATLMNEPVIVPFASGERFSLDGFAGTVSSLDRSIVRPEGAVVFALPNDVNWNPLAAGEFVDYLPEVVGAIVAERVSGDDAEPAEYSMPLQRLGSTVIAVAVKDTDGDLIYDPRSDWWGYCRVGNTIDIRQILVANFEDRSGYVGDASIVLRPPVGTQ